MKHDEFRTVRGYELLNQNKKELTSAMEDYLEMIYRNIEQEGYMRINTLSELLNVKPSSATRMVQKLKELGLINYEKYGITERSDFKKGMIRAHIKRMHNLCKSKDNKSHSPASFRKPRYIFPVPETYQC